MTRQKLLQLSWEVLIYPLYLPDTVLLDAIDFGLYKILLMEKISIPWKTVEGTWNSSLLKKIKFWEDEIMKLPEKWQKIVEQNCEYVVQ